MPHGPGRAYRKVLTVTKDTILKAEVRERMKKREEKAALITLVNNRLSPVHCMRTQHFQTEKFSSQYSHVEG